MIPTVQMATREALRQFACLREPLELHQVHVDVILDYKFIKLDFQAWVVRILEPMVQSLHKEIPRDAVFLEDFLSLPKNTEGANERWAEIAMRGISTYDIYTDTVRFRLDVRFWSVRYTKILKRRALWRAVKHLPWQVLGWLGIVPQ